MNHCVCLPTPRIWIRVPDRLRYCRRNTNLGPGISRLAVRYGEKDALLGIERAPHKTVSSDPSHNVANAFDEVDGF